MKRILLILLLVLFGAFTALSQNADKHCAALLDVFSDPETIYKGEEGFYTARTDLNLIKRTVRYDWTVKGGKILEGQNTASIKILRESNSLAVALKVRVEPDDCVMEIAVGHEIDVFDDPRVVDEYGDLSPPEEKESLDKFFGELTKNPNDQGYIFVADDKSMKRRLRFLLEYIDAKKIDRSRVSFLLGADYDLKAGRGYNIKTVLLLVPPGASSPKCNDCLDVRADDAVKLEEIFKLQLKN
jgi:hypothetical protein